LYTRNERGEYFYTPEQKKQRTEASKRWQSRNRELVKKRKRGYRLKYGYGMSVDDYNSLYTAQDGRCVTCARFFEKLVVDHDHQTRKVRGLLCFNCNSALGFVEDDILVLRAMIEYLEKSNG
jgi:recombination endonuclease VII